VELRGSKIMELNGQQPAPRRRAVKFVFQAFTSWMT
jgi:hypothetical protein